MKIVDQRINGACIPWEAVPEGDVVTIRGSAANVYIKTSDGNAVNLASGYAIDRVNMGTDQKYVRVGVEIHIKESL